jgi:hypothetical protein
MPRLPTLLLAISAVAFAYDYTMKPDKALCFFEEVSENKLIIAEFLSKSEKPEHKTLHLLVYNPDLDPIFDKSNMSMLIFSHVALIPGNYQFCIKNEGAEEYVIEINIKTGAMARDFLNLATTSDFKTVENRMLKAEKMAEEIHSNI